MVIAGSGRVGRSIADALSQLTLPFVLVESDDRRVQQARVAGRPVIYGDASQPVVLEAAGIRTRASHPGDGPGLCRRSQHRQGRHGSFGRICRSSRGPMAPTPFVRCTRSASRR